MRTTLLACLVAVAAFGAASPAFPQTPPAQTPDELPPLPPLPEGGGGKIEELEQEICETYTRAREIGGGKTIKQSLDNVKTSENEVKDRIRSVDEAIENAGGTQEGLQAAAQELGEQPIFTMGDAAQEGGEQAGEKVVGEGLKRIGLKGAARALDWVMLFGDVLEYGGKIVIRKMNVSDMKDLVRQQRITLNQLYDLAIYLRTEETRLRNERKELETLRAKNNAAWNALAEERERWRQQQAPRKAACEDAETRREWDTAGDKEELRLHQKEQKKKMKVTLAAAGGGALLGVGLLASGGSDSTTGGTPPSAPQTPTTPPSGPPSPPTSGAPPAGLFGVQLVCIDNPRGHHEQVRADQVSQVEVTGTATIRSAAAATITFGGPSPWVGVTGTWDPATGRFTATGRGRVAGNASIRCNFDGTLTPSGELEGDYVMGVGGGLPGGGTVTYRVQGRKN